MRSNRTELEPLLSKCGRTELNPNHCFQNAVEPNQTRTAAFKMRSNRTKPSSNHIFQNKVEPNRTRTAVFKMRSNRTEPEPLFAKCGRTEPNRTRIMFFKIQNQNASNSNLCFQNAVEPNRIAVFKMRSNRTELEPLFSKCAHVSPCGIGARTSRWYALMREMSQRTYAHLYVPICHVRCA